MPPVHPPRSIEYRLQIARDYAARHGHLVPRDDEAHGGIRLGRRPAQRRSEARRRTLPFRYQRALNEIYPWWTASEWGSTRHNTYAQARLAACRGELPFPDRMVFGLRCGVAHSQSSNQSRLGDIDRERVPLSPPYDHGRARGHRECSQVSVPPSAEPTLWELHRAVSQLRGDLAQLAARLDQVVTEDVYRADQRAVDQRIGQIEAGWAARRA
ncbi:helicase associated domain-containing protein [Streptomyces sp. NPDC052101]|uniref:helicase associated domain-containing protein n=1 Tax=Streptomyces sp. NPDC052101 TaxID=3155763 RepID=UPI0034290263